MNDAITYLCVCAIERIAERLIVHGSANERATAGLLYTVMHAWLHGDAESVFDQAGAYVDGHSAAIQEGKQK